MWNFTPNPPQEPPTMTERGLDAMAHRSAGKPVRPWTAGELFQVVRVAITGRKVSTPLPETMEILGRDECLARLDDAIGRLRGEGTDSGADETPPRAV